MNSTKKQRILFLYTELAGYTIASLQSLAEYAEVTVVHWPVNSEAPFAFDFSSGNYIEKDEGGKWKTHIDRNQIDVCIVSGWVDREYVAFAKQFKKSIPVILTLDNHWEGRLKQRLAALLSPFTLQKTFTHAWVPGTPQAQYAKALGFEQSAIRTGFYTADLTHFNSIYKQRQQAQSAEKKRFLYVGRYVAHKGIVPMWNAFEDWVRKHPEWELWCAGTGAMWGSRKLHPKIKHLGFVQPNDMTELLTETSVYILPSTFEPWGVSVHEMAAAGFPLVLSKSVGSHEAFLVPGENGVLLEGETEEAFCKAFDKMAALSASERSAYGDKSHELAQCISQEQWLQTVLTFAKK